MLKTLPLTVISFLVGMGMLAAQISFSVPNIETCQTTVSVPVTVTGFNNISAFSYSMEWNETVLDFDSVGAFNLAYLDASDFGTSQQANGIMTTAWIDNDGVGKSRPNGTVIYRVYFTVIGPVGSTSPVQFKDLPTPIIAAAGFPPVVLITTTNDGSVTHDDTVPPTISCPAAQTVSTTGTTAVVNGLAPTAADNCVLTSVTYSSTGATNISGSNNASGSTFNLGTTTVTYVATDGEGNTNNCAVAVTVNQVVNAVVFSALSDTAYCADTTVSIAITTENFENIIAFSFTLSWDESVIRYVSFTNPGNLPFLDNGDFGFSPPLVNNGLFTVAWVDDQGLGKTLPDGDTLFILNFVLNGSPGDESLIEFTDMPTDIIAAKFPAIPQTVVTENGNAAFIDNPPVIVNCPMNITVNSASGTCSQVATWTPPTATDDCDAVAPVPVRTVGPAPGSSFPVGVTTITYVATDSQGGVSSPCTFTVTVLDTQAPSITCPGDSTLFSNASCEATIGNYISSATVTDNNCPTSGITVTQQPAPGTIITDTTVVTLIATDAAGLKDTCTFNINLVDNTDPVITCPSTPAPVFTDSIPCTAMVVLDTATATDNCGIESITDNRPAGNIFTADSTTVTFIATDYSGNTATCSVVVVVNDTIVPVITCPANISASADTGACSTVVTWAAPTIVDNCASTSTVTCTPPSGTEFPVGDSTVVCIVVDPSGNSDTCTFVVTVTDDELPLLECRADTTIQVPIGTADTIVEGIYRILYTDNCSFDTAYYHLTGALTGEGDGDDAGGTAFPPGTTTVTYFGEDAAGNVGSCAFDVIIEEVIIFELNCSANQSADANANSCSASFTGVTADVIPDSSLMSATFTISGATTGSGSGLDASGSYNVGVSTVTFTAISNSDDTLTCSVNLAVTDNTDPIFANCPTDTIQLGNTIDSCGLVFDGVLVLTATDNCPGVTHTYNHPIGSLLPLGDNTITSNATDAAGNTATCTYTLNVIDNQPPQINNCMSGDTIAVNVDPGHCGAVVTWPDITADGNCNDVLSFTFTPMGSGSTFPVGSTPVSYTAVDNIGNTAICTFHVIVTDNEAPIITCPGNQPPVNVDLNQCSGTVNFPAPTATDNCGSVTPIALTSIGPSFAVGLHTITYSATDAAGNSSTCSFTVSVVDNIPPFIPGMPADIITDTDPGDCGATVTWIAPNFPTDNCAIESFGSTGGTSGDFFAVGTHNVIYVAFDVNGNFTRDTLTITVEDNQAPEITGCGSGASISVDGGTIDDPDGIIASYQQMDCDNIQLFLTELIPTDDCGIASFSQTVGLPTGSAFPVGPNVFTYQATDNNGNVSTCSFTINVLAPQVTAASVAPTPVCEGEDVMFTVGGMPGASYLWVKGNQTVSNQQSFTLSNVTVSQGGTYTALVSMAFCDLEFDVNLTVNPSPNITAIANDILCATADLNLTATNNSTAVITDWKWTFPNGAMVTGQNQTVPNPTTANAGTYTVVATSSLGCTGSSSVTVDPSVAPDDPFLFGTKSNICLGEDITINGQLYSGNNVTYHWYSIPAMGSGLLPINNPIVNVEPTIAGSYNYYFYVEVDGCVSDTAEWALVVGAFPVIDLDVTGETQCVDGGSDITLTDNGTGAVTWKWYSQAIGDLPGNTSSVVLIDVTPAFNGEYTVTATSSIGCSSTASTLLTFTAAPSPPAPLVLSSNSICENGSVTLTGTFYPGATYYWEGNGVPPNSQGQYEITAYPSGTGSFIYSFAATVGDCSTDTITAEVVVEVMPAVNITVTGQTDCVDGTTSITLSTPSTGIATFNWIDPNGNLISSASTATIDNVTSANAGFYSVSLEAAVTGCVAYGDTQLDISDGIFDLSALLNSGGCENDALNFTASTTAANASYHWFTPGGALFSTQQNPTIADGSVTGEGIYTVVAENSGGCADTATVDVRLLGEIIANDGDVMGIVDIPQEFNISDFVNFNYGDYTVNILQQPLNGTVELLHDSIYVFTPNEGFWGTDNLIVEFCNVNCPDVCDIAKITLLINFDPEKCVITTVISPNDDGANDEFIVSCAASHPLNKLVIFNEWGGKVFDAAPYDNTWEGTYEGKPLPDGTYFYIFQRDPDTAVQKGFVMILR